jgi:uncharacterized protein (DUF1684 family)
MMLHTRLKAALLWTLIAACGVQAQDSYSEKIEAWRAEREAELKADGGWLAVVGLFWLKDGANSLGSDPASDILLPEGAPPRAGVIEFRGGKAVLHAKTTSGVRHKGRPVERLEMRSDEAGEPDAVEIGSLTMFIIKRGGRYAVRVKDANSRARREFSGMRWYAVNESFKVEAQFFPYEKMKDIEIPNIVGNVEIMKSPGYVVFEMAGREGRLEPVISGKQLLFIFSDPTNGKATYPAGRFLYTEMAEGGRLTLDFNQAVNPPCAFTKFATCPLPPRQNRLKVAIEAGELKYQASEVRGQGLSVKSHLEFQIPELR